jgi:hypothetical protein
MVSSAIDSLDDVVFMVISLSSLKFPSWMFWFRKPGYLIRVA